MCIRDRSTKVAAQNSLYLILISQITSVTTTLFTKTVPEFEWLWLVLMVAGGIGGGAAVSYTHLDVYKRQGYNTYIGQSVWSTFFYT